MNRACANLALALSMFLGGCSDSSGPTEGQYKDVNEILEVLESGGIVCENLTIRDAAEIAQREAAKPAYTPPPGAVPFEGPEYAIREYGICEFEGSPDILGKVVSSFVTVYEDDEHLESLPNSGAQGIAQVYGDNWEIQLSNIDLADDVARMLDGRVIPPLDMPISAEELAAAGPGCFFIAALPPGLASYSKTVGISTSDPERFAQGMGESLYFLPQHLQAVVQRRCLNGLRVDAAIRADASSIAAPQFRDFWLDVCRHAPSDFFVTEALQFQELNFQELGSALTRHFLEKTSISRSALEDLERRCGAGVKEGV